MYMGFYHLIRSSINPYTYKLKKKNYCSSNEVVGEIIQKGKDYK